MPTRPRTGPGWRPASATWRSGGCPPGSGGGDRSPRPRLWLLDEPHAGLDAHGRDLLDDLVRGAAADGATVLLASHELERATPLAHREVVVAGGHVDHVDAEPAGVA
jgi:ABC-type hemin transport system ATPase subunit